MCKFNAVNDKWYMVSDMDTRGNYTIAINAGKSFQIAQFGKKFIHELVNEMNLRGYANLGKYTTPSAMRETLSLLDPCFDKFTGKRNAINHQHPDPIVAMDDFFSEKREYWYNWMNTHNVFTTYEMREWLKSYGYTVKIIDSWNRNQITQFFNKVRTNCEEETK